MFNTFMTFVRRAALAAALAAFSGLAAAGTIHVSIDTSVFDTDSGYLDMYMSATTGVPLATATISNISGFDKSNLDVDFSYGFTDTAAGYLLSNDTLNYLSHAVGFGGALSFDVTFAGDHDPVTTYVSHLFVSVFDSDFLPLGHYDPRTGAMLDLTWTPSPVEGGQGSVGTVPEPGALLLMGIGATGMLVARRRRATRQAA